MKRKQKVNKLNNVKNYIDKLESDYYGSYRESSDSEDSIDK